MGLGDTTWGNPSGEAEGAHVWLFWSAVVPCERKHRDLPPFLTLFPHPGFHLPASDCRTESSILSWKGPTRAIESNSLCVTWVWCHSLDFHKTSGDNPWLQFWISTVSLCSGGSGRSIPSSTGTIYHGDAAGFQRRQKENTGNVFIKGYKRFAV